LSQNVNSGTKKQSIQKIMITPMKQRSLKQSKNEDDTDKNLITLDVTLDMGSGASKYEVKISLENENDRHERSTSVQDF